MIEAFDGAAPAPVRAYYRRALPRFLEARRLLRDAAIACRPRAHLPVQPAPDRRRPARRLAPRSGNGRRAVPRSASHGFDLLDFLLGPIIERRRRGQHGRQLSRRDLTTACFRFESGMAGTGVWNFNAGRSATASS